ncbi:sodium:proton antiporter [Alteromonas sp. ZYF713]|nr:sodium:proton antiporter [Alteromonas sp. ZYF713]
MLDKILILLAVIALLGVVFEEQLHINKAKVTLFFGTIGWILLFVFAAGEQATDDINASLLDNITEISTLWLFLVATMTFVAYLNRKGLISHMLNIIMPTQITLRKLMFITALFSFTFSSLADNITATLVAITLVLSLGLAIEKTIRFCVLVVFAVNSGGVSLITGDVTTLMVFMHDKVTIPQLLLLLGPSFIAVMVLASLLSIGLNGVVRINKVRAGTIDQTDLIVAGVFICTIIFTLLLNILFSIPPMLTFLAGLSLMFLVVNKTDRQPGQDPILNYVRYIEFDTLLFFLGVLLLVGMLEYIDVLHSVAYLYDVFPTYIANYLLGALSALIDNVPLTAAILKADISMSVEEWILFTYAVGVGGSLLVIGSAAGIVAMSKVEDLSFTQYGRYFLLLALAYSFGYGLVYLLTTIMVGAE